MKTVEMDEAKGTLAEYARGLRREPVILTRRGKPVAALVSVEDEDWESISLSTNPEFMAIIERSRRRHAAEGGIPIAEVRRRLGLAKTRRRR
ncbi:MAG TPA: type II toxin-antitoxin system prevent-host-death family antitoxin [Planctomycetota bacterium]|nr:type II toxin-antitoxin system prevent-host-death family antitoxin [Planctomycetota bacterium]